MREVFEKAAQILMEGGHCKFKLGDIESGEGEHCAVGALIAAAAMLGIPWGPDEVHNSVIEPAQAAAAERGYQYGIVDFNNAPETTGEDVILLFKELAQ